MDNQETHNVDLQKDAPVETNFGAQGTQNSGNYAPQNQSRNEGSAPAPGVGWYMAMTLFFLIPVVGLIAAIIALIAERKNPSKRNLAVACTIWSVIGLLLFGAGVYFAVGEIKKYDGYLHEYLGDYGKTSDLAKNIIDEDVDAVLAKVDLNLLAEKLNLADMLKKVDISTVVSEINLEEVLKDADLTELLKDVDLSELLKNVDMSELLKNVDLSELLKEADMNEVINSIGIDEIAKNIDINEILPKLDLKKIDTSKIDFSQLDLKNADLSMLDMSQVDMSTLNLSNADMSKIDFSQINWDNFSDAQLKELYNQLPKERLK